MKNYLVEMRFTGYEVAEIEAENEEQARKLAMDEFDMSFAELDDITEVVVSCEDDEE